MKVTPNNNRIKKQLVSRTDGATARSASDLEAVSGNGEDQGFKAPLLAFIERAVDEDIKIFFLITHNPQPASAAG